MSLPAFFFAPLTGFTQAHADENAFLKIYDPVMIDGSFTSMLHNPTDCLLTVEVSFGKEVQPIVLEASIYYRVQFRNWPQDKITAKALDKCPGSRGDNRRLNMDLKSFFAGLQGLPLFPTPRTNCAVFKKAISNEAGSILCFFNFLSDPMTGSKIRFCTLYSRFILLCYLQNRAFLLR